MDQENLPAKADQSAVDASGTSSSTAASSKQMMAALIDSILGTFWHDQDASDEIQALDRGNWVSMFSGFTRSEVHLAWQAYQRTGPRTQRGTLYKPDAGAIYLIMHQARRDAALQRPRLAQPVPERERISPERAAEIMREVGFRGAGSRFGEEIDGA